jgi:hypothetical protein
VLPGEASVVQWQAGLLAWTMLQQLLAEEWKLEQFLEFLSEDERHSFRVLYEWSTAAYCEPSISLHPMIETVFAPEAWNRDSRPRYQFNMQRLFRQEIVDAIDFPPNEIYFSRLPFYRREAIVRAHIQEKSFDVLNGFDAVPTSGDSQSTFDKPVAPAPKLHIIAAPSNKQEPAEHSRSLPYFLWDREAQRTVEVAEVGGYVAYTVISHTWGRWAKQNEPATGIDGVPWPIPQNTRFEVLTLPQRLAECPCTTPYVWIDLFCIPQGERLTSEIAQQEIGRQGEIFSSADQVFMWLTDLEDRFQSLPHVIEIMLLDTLQVESRSLKSNVACEQRKRLETELTTCDFDLYKLIESSPIGERVLNSWFTSLWTLQEVWLRPDMTLNTLHWKPVNLSSGWEPDLLSIVAIIRCWVDECNRNRTRQGAKVTSHAGERLLQVSGMNGGPLIAADTWLRVTSLTSLLDPTPLQILAMASLRQCTSRRAEAIMSAIGTTNWFSHIPYNRHEQNLVLGRYNLAFLEEVIAIDPHSFYCRSRKLPGEIGLTVPYSAEGARRVAERAVQETTPREFRDLDPTRVGSLLPFDEHGGMWSFDKNVVGSIGHDTVLSWKVELSAHIQIPKACVLTSNRLPGIAPLPTEVDFSCFTNSGPLDRDTTAQEWTETRPFEVHIVVVQYISHTPNESDLPSDELATLICLAIARDGAGRLVCIGRCNVDVIIGERFTLPEARTVNWHVA